MSAEHDLFLSYRWADKATVEPRLTALQSRGISVWQDSREVDDLASIQHAVNTGLANARAAGAGAGEGAVSEHGLRI